MELSEILAQPDGFTPPMVTVKIKKVWEYKSGNGNNGPWSFQTVEVEGGRLKLKNLPQFPKEREGQSVILRANQSQQHGLTGIKVNHEQYNGKTYDQLVITNSCKWEWGSQDGAAAPQGTSQAESGPASSPQSIEGYIDHLLSCAVVTSLVTERMGVQDEQAIQSCFATICIDTKNRGIIFPANVLPVTDERPDEPSETTPTSMVKDEDLPPDFDDIPF